MAELIAHGSLQIPQSESGACACLWGRGQGGLPGHAFAMTLNTNADWVLMLSTDRFEQFPAERCHG